MFGFKKNPLEITPRELETLLSSGAKITIIDVRDVAEWKSGHLQTSKLVPLNDLPRHLNELDKEQPIICHCQHGMRSMRATEFLQKNGFKNARSLKGGLAEWAKKIDPSLSRY